VRLFVAVWPSEEVLERIAALPRPDVRGLRWTTPEQWHVTLRFFGEADVDEAVAVFRRIDVASTGDAVARLGPATGRFGQRVLHVPVEGLEALAWATVRATEGVGKPPDRRPFSGHVTLARSRIRGVDLRPLAGQALAGRWPVGELTLVCSRLGAGEGRAARYEVVERLALA
jgi:RNA 2',3'-cyclic 3'-phosphodiesterase